MSASKIQIIDGRGVPVRGDDLDTDRIMPARFLRAITFEGLERHVFEDDRRQLTERGMTHAFDVTAFQGARVLIVNANFGCGSSREHAPQALYRWGIRAVVGESFAEIFAGNSLMIGLACVAAEKTDVERLQALVEAEPSLALHVDVAHGRVTAGEFAATVTMPAATQQALVTGDWDATGKLLEHGEDVERTKARLPYLTNAW